MYKFSQMSFSYESRDM